MNREFTIGEVLDEIAKIDNLVDMRHQIIMLSKKMRNKGEE